MFILYFQYAIKLASKRNEKKLSAITELTSLDEKPIKIIDIGQREKDRDKDNRDREREWNYKNNHHINNNHHQTNHTSHVSIYNIWFSFQKLLQIKIFNV